MKKRLVRRISGILLVVVGVWMLVALGLAVAIHLSGNTSQPRSADVIIVLGSGLRRDGSPGDALYRRSVWAAMAYEQGLASAVICTGGQAENQRRSEASACRELLLERGVPPDAIYLEDQSRSTQQNAIFSSQIMAANGWQDALLVTDAFHMLRAGWIFSGEGIQHHAYPVPRDWVRTRWYLQLTLREIAALHWQAMIEVFNLPFTDFSL